MKKIPTVFTRSFDNHTVCDITEEFSSELAQQAFLNGVATIKWDGSCCAIIDGTLFKRYDAKHGKTPPRGAIACGEPDIVTGHHPHWVLVDEQNPADRWFIAAYLAAGGMCLEDGTYEAIGVHFQSNPYKRANDILVRHGTVVVDVERDFWSVRRWLEHHTETEGLVFWLKGEPVCKIRRKDFGYPWPGDAKIHEPEVP